MPQGSLFLFFSEAKQGLNPCQVLVAVHHSRVYTPGAQPVAKRAACGPLAFILRLLGGFGAY